MHSSSPQKMNFWGNSEGFSCQLWQHSTTLHLCSLIPAAQESRTDTLVTQFLLSARNSFSFSLLLSTGIGFLWCCASRGMQTWASQVGNTQTGWIDSLKSGTKKVFMWSQCLGCGWEGMPMFLDSCRSPLCVKQRAPYVPYFGCKYFCHTFALSSMQCLQSLQVGMTSSF